MIEKCKFQGDGSGYLLPVDKKEIEELVVDGEFNVADVDKVVGCGSVVEYNGIAELRSLVVDEPYKRRGLGTELIEECKKDAFMKGYDKLYSMVQESAYNIFRKTGFRKTKDPSEKLMKDCIKCPQYEKGCKEFGMVYEFPGNKVYVVKVGGGVLDCNTSTILEDIKTLNSHYNVKIAFVYGAGPQIDKRMGENDITIQKQGGLRVTTGEVMDVCIPIIEEIGKDIGSFFDDAELFLGDLYAEMDKPYLGFVGKAKCVQEKVKDSVKRGKVTIVSPMAKSLVRGEGYGKRDYLNCNADDTASQLAICLHLDVGIDGLYLATNVPSVMVDEKRVGFLGYERAFQLISDNKVSNGMKQKVFNAAKAVERGIPFAHIFDGKKSHNLLSVILRGDKGGTVIGR